MFQALFRWRDKAAGGADVLHRGGAVLGGQGIISVGKIRRRGCSFVVPTRSWL